MNYQNENGNGTSYSSVCTFFLCLNSHKYSMKRCLPGMRKRAQNIKQQECNDHDGKIYILKLSMFCYFESLGLLLQLKKTPYDSQEMGDVTCSFKTLSLYQDGLHYNTKLSIATGNPSLSAAGVSSSHCEFHLGGWHRHFSYPARQQNISFHVQNLCGLQWCLQALL